MGLKKNDILVIMKKILLTLSLSVSMFVAYGQTNLKTNTEDLQEGKATYQYYEDQVTGDFVKHGTFKYVKQKDGYTETATGTFNKGLRNGVWTYKIIGTDYPNSMGSYTTRTMNATLTYKEGMPNGVWKLTNFSKVRSKMLAPHNTFRWSDYEIITDDNVSMTFKNGVAVGTVTYKNKGKLVTYTLNELGYATGTHNINRYIGTETIAYKDGVVIKDIVRDASGKVIDDDSFILEDEERWLAVAKQYMNGELSEDDVLKLGADIFEKELSESVDVEALFQHDYLYLRSVGGDKTLKETSSFTTRNYGKCVVIKPIGIVHYYDHPKWRKYARTAISSYQGITSDETLADVEYLLNNCSNNLYPEDITELKELVQRYNTARKEIEKKQNKQKVRDEYEKILQIVSDSIQKELGYVNEKNTKMYAFSTLNSDAFHVNRVVSQNSLYIAQLFSDSVKVVAAKYQENNPASCVDGYIDPETIKQKLEAIEWEKHLSNIEKKHEEMSIVFQSFNKQIETIILNLQKLSDEILTAEKEYEISIQTEKKTPQIYLRYADIMSELSSLIQSKRNLLEINNLLETGILLSQKVQNYQNQENKSRIKLLKKAQSLDEKVRIFTE